MTPEELEALSNKIYKLYQLSAYSMEHRIRLKQACDQMYEEDGISLATYLTLLNGIPPTKHPEKDIFDSSYLIIKKIPSHGLCLYKCDEHGWELNVTEAIAATTTSLPHEMRKDRKNDGKKKNRDGYESGGNH
jgi:hypothetical protein